ncbi:MAG: TrmH family RNA methyltransferase [Bacteroidales bacterium]|jgi:tRNA G18 (ribose-2'-O)-methylase SpoU
MSNPHSSVSLFQKLKTSEVFLGLARPIIVADNLRTPENMGAVLRLAGNIGAQMTLFVAEDPPAFKPYKIKRTASGASEKTHWKMIKPSELSDFLPQDYQIIALETAPDAQNIYTTRLPEKMVMMVGNELTGISPQLMTPAHQSVYIPLPGEIYSLNVTHALAIGLFEWYRQWGS